MKDIIRETGDYHSSVNSIERDVKDALYSGSVGHGRSLTLSVGMIESTLKNDVERLNDLGMRLEMAQAQLGGCLTAVDAATVRAVALANEHDAIFAEK